MRTGGKRSILAIANRPAVLALAISSFFVATQAMSHEGYSWHALSGDASKNIQRTAGPRSPNSTHTVTSCADDGSAGTLRSLVESASTISGDTIDFSPQLGCDTIVLSAELMVTQDSLTIAGPGAGTFTLSGNDQTRIIEHTGVGTLNLSNLAVTHGSVEALSDSRGGCVSSAGNLALFESHVSYCKLSGPAATFGGAIFTAGYLALTSSSISHSYAYSSTKGAHGGGAYVQGAFAAKYAEISNNEARDHSEFYVSHGGGVFATNDVVIVGSTIAENRAEQAGGLELLGGISASVQVTNSTVSGNVALDSPGIRTKAPMRLSNSTVAFNRLLPSAYNNYHGAGIFLDAASLDLESSIVADNVSMSGADDISGSGMIIGSHSLVIQATLTLPADTRSNCPALQPLAYNGGLTRNHALGEHSFALEWGSNPENLTTDQRSAPRTVGLDPDSGAVERQIGETDERIFVAGFDGVCDQ